MIYKEGFMCSMELSGNGIREGKKNKSSSSFRGIFSIQHIEATILAYPSQFIFSISQNLSFFKLKERIRKNYLFWNVNQRRSSEQSKGVQSNNDHLGRGIRCHQLLKQLPGAGGQAGIMMHVLQNRDQLQFQVHRCGQTCSKEKKDRQSVGPLCWVWAVLRHTGHLHCYHC